MTRQEANVEILNVINEYIKRFPNLRFTQILAILDINISNSEINYLLSDLFYEEPTITLERVNKLKIPI